MAARESAASAPTRPRFSVGRVLLLAVTALCLYLFAPSIAEVFEAWNKLGEVHPAAGIAMAVVTVAAAIVYRLRIRGSADTPAGKLVGAES